MYALNSEDGSQKSEDRRRKTEVRRQNTALRWENLVQFTQFSDFVLHLQSPILPSVFRLLAYSIAR